MNIGLKANSSMGHQQNIRPDMGRNYDVAKGGKSKGQNNSRSNTIEQNMDDKKSNKRKERASSTIDHHDNTNPQYHNQHMINGASQVQVS